MHELQPLGQSVLPREIRSRFVNNGNGLRMHILEAGTETEGRPTLLLLHGFPELAYSWRKVMPDLAGAGYHVIAPDQRGYGRTTGWDPDFDGDVRSFRFQNLVRDTLGLLWALGLRKVDAVIGHDFGSPVAGCCALIRPDVFRSVIMMSAPFPGPPPAPNPGEAVVSASAGDMNQALAALDPPRKHYQWYYSTREANGDMLHCPQGVHDFMRAYYHFKSADWPGNRPHPLANRGAGELARMPHYYIMPLHQDMAGAVAPEMPARSMIDACAWLPDNELQVYAEEYSRTGFQGGLNWYRCGTGGSNAADLSLFSGRTIDVPAGFIAGTADWGVHQWAGDLNQMENTLCANFRGTHIVPGAGHWVQQEQPAQVSSIILDFIGETRTQG